MKKKLKLYVWSEFCPDYTDGLAFAIAADESEARKMIVDKMGFDPSEWGSLIVREINERFAAGVSGGS